MMMGVSIRGMDDGSPLGAGSRDCVRGPAGLLPHRPPAQFLQRAAEAVKRSACARRERQSRLSLRPRLPAGSASSRALLARVLRRPARLALAGLILAGGAGLAAPAAAVDLVSNLSGTPVYKHGVGQVVQGFVTGSNSDGYTLQSVTFKVVDTSTATVTAVLRPATSSNAPDLDPSPTALGTFTGVNDSMDVTEQLIGPLADHLMEPLFCVFSGLDSRVDITPVGTSVPA